MIYQRIGVTGTRYGWTERQRASFVELLTNCLKPQELHHGDCTGADTSAATEAYAHGMRVVGYPSVDETYRARNAYTHVWNPPETNFARNRRIVMTTDALIGIPYGDSWQPKGGTWYTLDYAQKKVKPVYIIWPSGKVRGNDYAHPVPQELQNARNESDIAAVAQTAVCAGASDQAPDDGQRDDRARRGKTAG